MSGTGKKKPALVAERRPTARKKPAAKPARSAARRPRKPGKRSRNPIIAFFQSIFGWILRLVWRLTWRMGAVLAMLLAAAVFYFHSTLPPVAELLDARTRGSVTLLDRYGTVFAWRGDQFGGQISAETVAPALRNAVIATEDKRFYRHFGVSPRGIASAVRINLREGRGPLSGNGGSTITQQTAKLLCLGVPFDAALWKSEAEYEADCRRTTLWRKVKEAVYAMAMEVRYTKNEVLTIYLNRAYLGAGARGFEAASERYFGKSANKVNAAEAAMLAGLLKAPSTYAPTNNLQRAQDRANVIVGLMEDQGYLTAAQAADARANPAELSDAAAARAGGYFADWVMESGPSFLTRDTTEDVIIRSTFDPRLQQAAEDAMNFIFENKVREGSKAQAAIVVMSADGAVRAMVGGRKTRVSGAFNRATMALRQTGSAFKPFVYAAALDLGFTPNATVVDEPITINVPGSGPYSPRNYTKDFKGKVTLTEALKHSLNIPAVRVSESVGRENVRVIASEFGIKSDLAPGPALALGTSESTLLEMTGAYAGILNGGRSVKPYGLIELRLQGDDTPLFDQQGGMGERVITEKAARGLTYMMNQVIEGGTGQRAKLPGREAAGKTGTTQAARDAWFIGFTADYVAGVWMGYDDNTPLTGVTGGGLPAEIWHETMVRVHEGLPASPLPMDVPAPVAAPAPQNTAARTTGRPAANQPERILREVLDAILGKR
ncbi:MULTISPECIES: transglycosylase domain-containing protein [Actibacterium]|uniref:peptidoglycan glycosyltransferase n=1 Tax=Actibacterium naphthalenivorans TaxID=1614693 RepID=A0A840CDI8_9RHOB|nr:MULTISPECIES: PBP1A family penicillin-binding protein [Actibacterium]ALG89085.1 glycosyl transferase [Actibacterium sp. EMB200-NS6]MBB4021349.1 1A family penicillin-binding protein [Actibacterium naphthalenivorans]